jgi:cytidyltransferase-like protein
MVLADGCFDPIHYGHVRYFDAAAVLGPLIVRVADDAEVRAKGRLLFQTRAERLKTIAQFVMVDAVCEDATLAAAVLRLQPKVLVKGQDWEGRMPADVIAACRKTGTAIIFLETQERSSTERLQA